MPLQRITLSREATRLLKWLEKNGPCQMNKAIFKTSAAAQELKKKCLVDYEDGTLRLIKDCRT